jgi:AraC-like DNA-binding protein
VDTEQDVHIWNGAPLNRHAWIDAMSQQGIQCRIDAGRPARSNVTIGSAGRTNVIHAELAWQVVSPDTHGGAGWDDDTLFLKIVRDGNVTIEQKGQRTSFSDGALFFVDPRSGFDEVFREPTRMTILKLSKTALRERGLRHRFQSLHAPAQDAPDVRAVRDFVLGLCAQVGKASTPLLERLGDQCLDLMDVVIGPGAQPASSHSSAATALRARQLIARRIGDPELSLAGMAKELNLSTSTLTRSLKASGLSPMRYAWSLRLERAARLLEQTPKGAIQEIAFQCGFASAAHFSRAFKERYAMTPREYAMSAALHSPEATDAAAAQAFENAAI